MEPRRVIVEELTLSTPVYSPVFEGRGEVRQILEYEVVVSFPPEYGFVARHTAIFAYDSRKENSSMHVDNLYLDPVRVVKKE